ncbi:MAG: hypothetical protein JNL11_14155 [Bdellovibrionaceae bacterium]|nr:hypothetical protein [Pseudobdellovibrionaceae bacterium]
MSLGPFILKVILVFLINLSIQVPVSASPRKATRSFQTPSPEIDYLEFKEKILLNPKVSTVAKTLRMLPQSYRSNYTLMHTSGSIQPGTFLNPRAILFGETGSLIITFNGDKSQYGYNALEIASYDENKKRISFRKIIFREDSDTNLDWTKEAVAKHERLDENIEDAVEYFDQRILISKPNQMVCMGCHSTKTFSIAEEKSKRPEDRLARYNWAAYDTWPGNYGKTEDVLIDDSEFQKFLENRKTNDRYQALYRPPLDDFFPYSDVQQSSEEIDLNKNPNSRLTMLVALRYAQQLANVIYKSDDLRKNYKSYMQALGCIENIDTLNQIIKKHGRLSLEFPPIAEFEHSYTLPTPVLDLVKNDLADLLFIQLAIQAKELRPNIYTLLPKTSNKTVPMPLQLSWNSNYRLLDLLTKNFWNIVPLYHSTITKKYDTNFRTQICDELSRRP